MKSRLGIITAAIWGAAFVASNGTLASQDLTDKPAMADAVVDFGHVHPQPPSPGHHVLVPNDVTIVKGGTVLFVMNGTGHAIAIYPVSKNTTRAHIEEDLCQGGPDVCSVAAQTAQLQYLITDGSGKLVIDTGTFPAQSRINSAAGELFSAGGGVFLTGSTAAGAAGTQVRHRFVEDGRYLVICTNRVHAINDWMFGFVNVV